MTVYFKRSEFIRSRRAEQLGIRNDPPESVIPALRLTSASCERLRAFLGHPMTVSSGYRSPALNKAVGGSANSQHMLGEAVDFTCPAFGTPREVAASLALNMEILGIDQLILEPGWVHCSFTLEPRFEVLHALAGGGYSSGLPKDSSD